MENLKDEDIFELINSIPAEEIAQILKEIKTLPEEDGEYFNKQEIINKTHQKLGLIYQGNRSTTSWKRSYYRLAVASIMLIFFTSSFALTASETVRAKLKDIINYIPGFGVVIEEKGQEQQRYVLDTPIVKDTPEGRLTISGVAVESKYTIVRITGSNTFMLDNALFTLVNAKGERFTSGNYSIGKGAGSIGEFYFEGNVDGLNGLNLEVKYKNSSAVILIPLKLTYANKYETYEALGPTTKVNDFSLTAIPKLENGLLKVNFISPPNNELKVISFGERIIAERLVHHIKLKGRDKAYPLVKENEIGRGDEFYFNIQGAKEKEFILTVPDLKVNKTFEKVIELPIPESGIIINKQKYDIAGFPVEFAKIERLNNEQVRVYVNVLNDPNSPKWLTFFNIEKDYLSGWGWGAKINSDTDVVQYYEFEAPQGIDNIKLKITEPVILIKGPWQFKFNLPKQETQKTP